MPSIHKDTFWMRNLFFFVVMCFSNCSTASSETLIHEKLYAALQLNKIITILHDEGIGDGLKTGVVYLGKDYDEKAFRAALDEVYSLESMESELKSGIAESLTLETATHVLDFFSSDLGRQIATLETSARTVISDAAVERIVIDVAKSAKIENPKRYNLLEKNIIEMGFVELNMTGAFSAQFAFLSELSKLENVTITHDEILAMLMQSEAEMREEIKNWLMGFSYLAYQPLSDDELGTYLGFLTSSSGKELNSVLFSIFNALALKTSEGLASVIISFYMAREL